MFELPPLRPAIMGILNVTPDSFSDGGDHLDALAAIDAGKKMMDLGADLIDVGGESTRPGAQPVPASEQIKRIEPVIEALVDVHIPVSIDTRSPEVAEAALKMGASVVNDVSGMESPIMRKLCASWDCPVCVMHMQGTPETMQANPTYGDVVTEIRDFLKERADLCLASGIHRERIWLDPGIGFGKTYEHNLQLLANLDRLVDLGYPVLVGASRKGFLKQLIAEKLNYQLEPKERLVPGLSVGIVAQLAGARIIRTHDVVFARQAAETIAELNRYKKTD